MKEDFFTSLILHNKTIYSLYICLNFKILIDEKNYNIIFYSISINNNARV